MLGDRQQNTGTCWETDSKIPVHAGRQTAKYRYMLGDRQQNRNGVLCTTQKGKSKQFNKPVSLKQERLDILFLCDNSL